MLVGTQVRRVAVVGGVRIPFARGHGAYAKVGNQDMFTAVLQALVARYRIAGEQLGYPGQEPPYSRGDGITHVDAVAAQPACRLRHRG